MGIVTVIMELPETNHSGNWSLTTLINFHGLLMIILGHIKLEGNLEDLIGRLHPEALLRQMIAGSMINMKN